MTVISLKEQGLRQIVEGALQHVGESLTATGVKAVVDALVLAEPDVPTHRPGSTPPFPVDDVLACAGPQMTILTQAASRLETALNAEHHPQSWPKVIVHADDIRTILASLSAAEKEVERLRACLTDETDRAGRYAVKAGLAEAKLAALSDLAHTSSGMGVAIWSSDVLRILSALPPPVPAEEGGERLCEDCPPVGYVTDKTRCLPCPRRSAASEDFVDQDAADARSMSTEALEEAITQAPQDVAGLGEIKSAYRTHVPELEGKACNQRPKTSEHRDLKLYRYLGSDLYQWFSKRGESVFHDPCDEPFVIVGVRPSPISHETKALEPAAADNNHKALAEAEIDEADIPDIVERGRLGAALSVAESAAWSGYEIGWRDGSNDRQEGSR